MREEKEKKDRAFRSEYVAEAGKLPIPRKLMHSKLSAEDNTAAISFKKKRIDQIIDDM